VSACTVDKELWNRRSGRRKKPEGTTGGRLKRSASRQGCRVKKSPKGVTQGRSQYGNKYKHISTNNRAIAQSIEH
jgi:hypothetical protein